MDPLSSRLAQVRARQVLRQSGLPHDGELQRASSTNNEAFVGQHHVIRTNTEMNGRLSREGNLYPHLPANPMSPARVACGTDNSADYLVIERRPGGALAHAWPDLSREQRRDAVHQLGTYLAQLHTTVTPSHLPRLRRCPQLLDGETRPLTAPLLSGIRELDQNASIDRGLLADVSRHVADNLHHLDDFDERHLVHGDLTFENLLWDGNRLSAIIDFEWSRGGPADLDLDVLARCCAFPKLHVATDHVDRTRPEDYADVLPWMAEVHPTLFEHPALFERLVIYALSFEIGLLLRNPVQGARRGLGPEHPLNRIAALLGSGGHVADQLHAVGVLH
ncbi:MAG: phosphotransferase [Planctomycetota bacterium]